MNYNQLFEGLSLSKVFSGISKGLGLINQALPLYQQLKPIVKNANQLLSIFNQINTPDNNILENKNTDNMVETKEEKKVSNNLPTFFQ